MTSSIYLICELQSPWSLYFSAAAHAFNPYMNWAGNPFLFWKIYNEIISFLNHQSPWRRLNCWIVSEFIPLVWTLVHVAGNVIKVLLESSDKRCLYRRPLRNSHILLTWLRYCHGNGGNYGQASRNANRIWRRIVTSSSYLSVVHTEFQQLALSISTCLLKMRSWLHFVPDDHVMSLM